MSDAPTSRAHAPFALANRYVNPGVKWMVASPAHPAVSRWLCLVTVTGRKTGKRYTLPVSYRQDGDVLKISIAFPERKLWWRNLRGDGAPVEVTLRGRQRTGLGQAHETSKGAYVTVALDA